MLRLVILPRGGAARIAARVTALASARVTALAALLAIAPLTSAVAQDHSHTPAATGIRAELAQDLTRIGDRLVQLAEAIPEEHYSWRPGEGIRSVSEVFMHVAGANFFIPTMVGIAPPEGLEPELRNPRQVETITEKARVVDALRRSFEHARHAVTATPDADLDREVEMFGQKTSVRGVLLLLTTHVHEHLGQSIAYARSRGVVPPWSAAGAGEG